MYGTCIRYTQYYCTVSYMYICTYTRLLHIHILVYTCMPWWEFSFVYFLMEEGRGGGLAGRRGIDGFGGLD